MIAFRIVLLRLVALAVAIALAGCPAREAAPRKPAPLPAAAYGHYLKARLAIHRGDYERAVTELRAAAAAAPDEVMIAVALIDATYRTGARDAARDAVVAATARWPRAPEVWLVAGKVWRGLGDHARARRAYEQAIAIDGRHERAWLGLAGAWLALDEPAEAEAAYRRLIAAVPDSVDGRYALAERLVGRRADGDAEPHLRTVIELDPDHIDARLLLAKVLRRKGRLDEAIVETRQAFDRTAGDLGVAEELFWLLCEANDRQGALDLLGLLDDPAQGLSARLGIADLYRQLGALDEAVRVADAARADHPASRAARVVAAHARADRATGADRADALALLAEVPIEDDNGPAARALAATILRADGDAAAALALIEEARRARPDSVDLLSAHAEALHAAGDTAGGRALLEAAVRRRRGSVALRYALASYEDLVGRSTEAAAIAEKIVARSADHVAALNLAGYALAKAGERLERAERHLRRARELAPGDPSILDSWGWLLYRRGQLAEAEAALAHALHLAPHVVEIRTHLEEVRTRLRQK